MLLALWLAFTAAPTHAQSGPADRQHVVLISFDGVRHDYLDRATTPAFDRLAETGVKAESLISVFPSLTFPSHYSIATGLYPSGHGIVGNRFFDPARGEEFNYRDPTNTRDGSWWGGEPIWISAERQGLMAAAIFFPGTEADIGGFRPTHWRPYDGSVPNRDRVQQVLDWLELPGPQRPDLITSYFSLVDTAGHRLGPEADALSRAIRQADTLLGQLLAGIDRLPHTDRVSVVVVSDHGMATVDHERQVVLPDILDLRGVRAVALGPAMTLHLDGDDDRSGALVERFNARVDGAVARAYHRRAAPAHLHIENDRRYGDVLIVPASGVRVRFTRESTGPSGMHGWDPTEPSMHGIFLARGPAIMPGQRIPAFESVHIYPFLARLLSLVPNGDIDGSISVLAPVLTP